MPDVRAWLWAAPLLQGPPPTHSWVPHRGPRRSLVTQSSACSVLVHPSKYPSPPLTYLPT